MRKIFKIILLLVLLCVVVVFSTRYLPSTSARQNLEIDEAVYSVTITGANVPLHVTGHNAGTDITVQLVTQDRWGCNVVARSVRNASGVTIYITKSAIPLAWWCHPKATVLLPVPLNLNIDFENLVADIDGVFRGVEMHGMNAVVHFDGTADTFHMSADHAVVALDFAAKMARDAVVLDVQSLISHVTFDN